MTSQTTAAPSTKIEVVGPRLIVGRACKGGEIAEVPEDVAVRLVFDGAARLVPGSTRLSTRGADHLLALIAWRRAKSGPRPSY